MVSVCELRVRNDKADDSQQEVSSPTYVTEHNAFSWMLTRLV